MNKLAFALALAICASATAQAHEACAQRTVEAPVLAVNDLRQQFALPVTNTTCVGGVCSSAVIGTRPVTTEARYEIVYAVRGVTYSMESLVAPFGPTIPVTVEDCFETRREHRRDWRY